MARLFFIVTSNKFSKVVTHYIKLSGENYLQNVMKPLIQKMLGVIGPVNERADFEVLSPIALKFQIDPDKMQAKDNLPRNLANLKNACQVTLNEIVASKAQIPQY